MSGGKNRLEDLGDCVVIDDKRHALELGGKCREIEGAGERELLVRQNRKRQVQPRGRLLLIGGVLCRQTIELRDAQARELAEMIVE